MAKTTRGAATWLTAMAILISPTAANAANLAGGEQNAVGGAPGEGQHIARVRAFSPAVARLIQRATERSATFRGLIKEIEASDGIVIVEDARCPNRAPGCLLWKVTVAGTNRMLRIRVDTTRMADDHLAGVVGHELRHATEVLSHPWIQTDTAIKLLYRQIGTSQGGPFDAVETDAAIEAGNAVRAEIRAAMR